MKSQAILEIKQALLEEAGRRYKQSKHSYFGAAVYSTFLDLGEELHNLMFGTPSERKKFEKENS